MPVTAEAVLLLEQLDAQVGAIADEQTRALVAAWASAWAEVSGDLHDTLVDLLAGGGRISVTTLRRSLRLRAVLDQIRRELTTLAADAGVLITSDLQAVVDGAARAQTRILKAQLPTSPITNQLLDVDWTDRDDEALSAIVKRATEQITSLTNPLAADTYDVVRRELIRGVAVGSGPRETAARMVRRAEGRFNGGLTRALTIARTETLDAHRAAAAVGQAAHTDVLAGWVWHCHLGPRTCPACLVRHGTFHAADEPGPHDHPQGRCSRMPKTKSWADLGFDIDEPADDQTDARAWFDALPEAEQIQLLGRTRWDLLNSGQIQWEDLATLRHNTGWRDSWQMTPVTQLKRGRRTRSA